jgi:phospholipid transport system substrate-binding protein
MKNYKTALILAGLLGPSIVLAQSAASVPATAIVSSTAASTSCKLIDPQVFAQNAVTQVLGVLSQDKSQIGSNFAAVEQDIQTALTPLIGIDIMAQYVVQPGIWSSASATDQAAFKAAFLKFIIGLYSSPLKDFSNQTIEVYPSRVAWANQQNVQINSVIHNPAAGPGADIPVSLILRQQGCSWLFVDFVVDNISALANIQAQVQSILQNMKNPGLKDLTAVIVAHNNATSS